MRVSSHMLDATSSGALAAGLLAGCYLVGMKPLEAVRRDNLARLVGEADSQAAFARAIEKDKNQVNQWLGRAGSRNISAATARHIEKKVGKPPGWLDQDRDAVAEVSQSAGLDAAKLSASIEFVEKQFDLWGLDFGAADRSRLIAAVYVRMSAAVTPNLTELSRWLADQVKE